jgi:DNA-binding MarR family transcriptional regulator
MSPDPPAEERRDLAASAARLGRRLVAHEQEILAEHGVTMWGYTILSALRDGPPATQAALAARIGHDKTRVIADLDELQSQGYVTRDPNPRDRRARLVAITDSGRDRQRAIQRAIHRREDELLAAMPESDRSTLRRLLAAANALLRARETGA